MPPAKPPPESLANGAGNGADGPLARFKNLTRNLLGVSPPDLREAEHRDKEQRKAARAMPRGRPAKPS